MVFAILTQNVGQRLIDPENGVLIRINVHSKYRIQVLSWGNLEGCPRYSAPYISLFSSALSPQTSTTRVEPFQLGN